MVKYRNSVRNYKRLFAFPLMVLGLVGNLNLLVGVRVDGSNLQPAIVQSI